MCLMDADNGWLAWLAIESEPFVDDFSHQLAISMDFPWIFHRFQPFVHDFHGFSIDFPW